MLEGYVTTWRSAILLESHKGPWKHASAAYHGIRTSSDRKYLKYANGFTELYDLNTDPYELTNGYDAAMLSQGLATRLAALKECSGDRCRRVEDEL